MTLSATIRNEVEATKATILAQRASVPPIKVSAAPLSKPASLSAQSIPSAFTPLALDPTPVTPPVVIAEGDLGKLLDSLLPPILAGVDEAKAAFGDKKLSWSELISLAGVVQALVSKAIMEGAPLIKGQSATNLVNLVFGVLFDRYAVPLLPFWAKLVCRSGQGQRDQGTGGRLPARHQEEGCRCRRSQLNLKTPGISSFPAQARGCTR